MINHHQWKQRVDKISCRLRYLTQHFYNKKRFYYWRQIWRDPPQMFRISPFALLETAISADVFALCTVLKNQEYCRTVRKEMGARWGGETFTLEGGEGETKMRCLTHLFENGRVLNGKGRVGDQISYKDTQHWELCGIIEYERGNVNDVQKLTVRTNIFIGQNKHAKIDYAIWDGGSI